MTSDAAPPTRRWATWVVALTLVLGFVLVYCFREVFGPLLLALAFAYILEPLVVRLERRTGSRLRAVAVIFLVGGLVAVGLAVLLVIQAFRLVEWLTAADGLIPSAAESLGKLFEEHLADRVGEDVEQALQNRDTWKAAAEPLAAILVTTLSGLLSTFTLLGVVLLLPVYQFYLMLELPRLWQWIREHLPGRSRERTLRVLGEIHAGFAAFLRGRVVIAVLKGAATALGLILLGTPLALIIGLGAGLLSILPFVGPTLGFLVAAAVTLANDPGLMPLVWVVVVFLVAEGLENFVFTPWVMTEGVSLHPLTVLFSIVFWAAALGLFGALIAIPLTLVAKILLREYVLPSVDRLADTG